MIEPTRKPKFLEQDEDKATDFMRKVAAARAENPAASYESVLAATAKKYPNLYQQHSYKIAGNNYATDSFLTPPDTNYFKQVSDLIFSELRKVDPDIAYSRAVSITATTYPRLHEGHIAERTGIPIRQTQVRLSDREEAAKKPLSKDVGFDRLRFARKAFPFLIQSHLTELKRHNKDAAYETALREAATIFSEMYLDYQLSTGA